jgi:hypothetical protein
MAKCGVGGCTDTPIGGFQEVLNVGHMQDPGAEMAGSGTFWCADHESALRPKTFAKQGYYLSKGQLPKA